MANDGTATGAAADARYRLLVEAIADYAIFMLDPTGHVASWNPGARRVKGYAADEIIGQHFSRFYPAPDRDAGLPARALEIATDEGRFEHEGWRVRKDGAQFWAHVVIEVIRSPSGELLGFAKITRDLTEQRAQRNALARSEEQFRLLVQSVTDYAIYMLDPVGRVTSWNSGAERIKGYRPVEIIGQSFDRFYTPEDRAAGLPQQALQTALREGRFETDGWRVRKDGSRFWASVVVDAIRDDFGAVIGFAKVTRDITERRATQLSLEQARDQLLQAQKLDAIGQLTGGIAHDFNNLLTAILASLELVRKHLPDDPRITRLIDNAEHGARRGATLTQRLLAYARRQPLKLQAVDVPVLVNDLVTLIEPSLGPAVRLEAAFPDGPLGVVTDPNQLDTAILNLCLNARDAMPEGGVITLRAARHSLGPANVQGLERGDYVCLTVSDQGEGMDEATLTKAAEPFFTTKGVGKGSGLGLPMVHGLAAQSGGKLILKSSRGAGTTAELWLPTADSVAPPLAPAAPHQAEAASRPLSILAVDDDALVLMNTAMMLEDLGHRVVEAGNGRQALAALETSGPFDLVISDHAMPEMTGSQLAATIHATWPDLPVLLATGYAELPGGSQALPLLSKPFSQSQLADAVAAALRPPAVLPA